MKIISIILFIIAFILFMAVIQGIKSWRSANDNKTKNKATAAIFFLTILCFIFILSGIAAWNPAVETHEIEKPVVKKFNPDSFKTEASLISRQFLEQKLKAPATAQYPSTDGSDVTYLQDSTFYVRSYVDAENSYGALLRSYYYAKMKYKGGGNWVCLDINLIEQ